MLTPADSEFPEWLEAPLALQAFTGNIPVLPIAPLLAEPAACEAPAPPKRQYLNSRACDRYMSEHKQALRVKAKRARELNSSFSFVAACSKYIADERHRHDIEELQNYADVLEHEFENPDGWISMLVGLLGPA